MQVLIIDDDRDFCQLMTRIIETKEHSVSVCHTLVDGLHFLEETEPAIIFLDNYLPDGEGWPQAAAIKTKFPNCTINLMSAEDKSFLRKYHFDGYVWEKPITRDQITNFFNHIS